MFFAPFGMIWPDVKIPEGFPRISAVLAEISASTAEISKRLVDFCIPEAGFSCKVSENPQQISCGSSSFSARLAPFGCAQVRLRLGIKTENKVFALFSARLALTLDKSGFGSEKLSKIRKLIFMFSARLALTLQI